MVTIYVTLLSYILVYLFLFKNNCICVQGINSFFLSFIYICIELDNVQYFSHNSKKCTSTRIGWSTILFVFIQVLSVHMTSLQKNMSHWSITLAVRLCIAHYISFRYTLLLVAVSQKLQVVAIALLTILSDLKLTIVNDVDQVGRLFNVQDEFSLHIAQFRPDCVCKFCPWEHP